MSDAGEKGGHEIQVRANDLEVVVGGVGKRTPPVAFAQCPVMRLNLGLSTTGIFGKGGRSASGTSPRKAQTNPYVSLVG